MPSKVRNNDWEIASTKFTASIRIPTREKGMEYRDYSIYKKSDEYPIAIGVQPVVETHIYREREGERERERGLGAKVLRFAFFFCDTSELKSCTEGLVTSRVGSSPERPRCHGPSLSYMNKCSFSFLMVAVNS